LVEVGPRTCSTAVGLLPIYRIIWDTNCYYRDLGVSVYANKREIREAYQALDGQRSERLTYVMHQLLDPIIRARYDATPFGAFMRDEYVNWVERVADARRISLKLAKATYWEREEILLEAEFEQRQEAEEIERQVLDSQRQRAQTVGRQPWGYSYYLWRTSRADLDDLERWQELLVRACSCHRVVVELAVGFVGSSPEPIDISWRDGHLVALLRDDQVPTEALAERVAHRVEDHNT
jgi:hypothetical protein